MIAYLLASLIVPAVGVACWLALRRDAKRTTNLGGTRP